jgi:tRNA U38,U39,U40 pseudouridine synthase TruA
MVISSCRYRRSIVATTNEKTEKDIRAVWNARAAIRRINDRIACQSRKYVYGTDETQLSFISKRLGLKHTADPLEGLTYEQLKAAATLRRSSA